LDQKTAAPSKRTAVASLFEPPDREFALASQQRWNGDVEEPVELLELDLQWEEERGALSWAGLAKIVGPLRSNGPEKVAGRIEWKVERQDGSWPLARADPIG
jgi:hypothetical protein